MRRAIFRILIALGPAILPVAAFADGTAERPAWAGLSDDEIKQKMEALNRKAATRPDAAARLQQQKDHDAATVAELRKQNHDGAWVLEKNSKITIEMSGIDADLARLKAERASLVQQGNQLWAQRQSDLAVAADAGKTTTSGVIGHTAYGGTSENQYVSLEAVRKTEAKYDAKINPMTDRVAAIDVLQKRLLARKAELRMALFTTHLPQGINVDRPQDQDPRADDAHAKLEAMYPGVDIDAVYAQALADASKMTGVDPKTTAATTPAGKALATAADALFNERAAAQVKPIATGAGDVVAQPVVQGTK